MPNTLYISDRMPAYVLDRPSEYMPGRMPNRMFEFMLPKKSIKVIWGKIVNFYCRGHFLNYELIITGRK